MTGKTTLHGAGATKWRPPDTSKVEAKTPEQIRGLLNELTPAERKLAQKYGINPIDGSSLLPAALKSVDRSVEFDLVEAPGRLAYLNFALARKIGLFDLICDASCPPPAGDQLTPELERRICALFSWRAKRGDEPGRTRKGEADRYGGTSANAGSGSGRVALLPLLNVGIKGILTPLVDQSRGFSHSHGGASIEEGLREAIVSDVTDNLMTHGANQILAVIARDDETKWSDGGREPRGLIVRVGNQLRPAHLFEGSQVGDFTLPVFESMAEISGVAVHRNGRLSPSETLRKMIDRVALTSAEHVRWRMLMGAPTDGNFGPDGMSLDMGTVSTQPRTAPVHSSEGAYATFSREHLARIEGLERMQRGLMIELSGKAQAEMADLDVNGAFLDRYNQHLHARLASSAGLGSELIDRLGADSDPVFKFGATVRWISEIHDSTGDLNADRRVVRDASPFDVFNFLRRYAPVGLDPSLDAETKRAKALELLEPLLDANHEALNRYLDSTFTLNAQLYQQLGFTYDPAAKPYQELVRLLVESYDQLMAAAAAHVPELYGDPATFRTAVIERSELENRPIPTLYRPELRQKLLPLVERFDAAGAGKALFQDPALERQGAFSVSQASVDRWINTSLRNTENLLTFGEARALGKDSFSLQGRRIDGVDYALVTRGRNRVLRVSLPATIEGGRVILPTRGGQSFRAERIDALAFRFTTHGWEGGPREAPAKLVQDGRGAEVVFEIPIAAGAAGELEGVFRFTDLPSDRSEPSWIHRGGAGAENFYGFTFVSPTDHELSRTVEALGLSQAQGGPSFLRLRAAQGAPPKPHHKPTFGG